jgi:ABC-type transporter Mla subunit MlaD
LDTAATRLGALGRQAQRVLLIQVGAAAAVGDKVRKTARTYTSLDRVEQELDRFERRGARMVNDRQRAFGRRRRELRHDVRRAGSELETRARGLQTDAKETAEQVLNLI